MDQVTVKALISAQALEKDQVSKERRGVALLEVMARHPDWWKTCGVVEVVKGLNWTPEKDMMGEAVKLVWNSWLGAKVLFFEVLCSSIKEAKRTFLTLWRSLDDFLEILYYLQQFKEGC